MDQTTQQHDAELEARYEQERIKRMTEGVRTYRSLRDLDVDFDADPYIAPGIHARRHRRGDRRRHRRRRLGRA